MVVIVVMSIIVYKRRQQNHVHTLLLKIEKSVVYNFSKQIIQN